MSLLLCIIASSLLMMNESINPFSFLQGPLPGTVSEFWRLVWEQRVGVVVMITNLVEQGKRKCEQYWPETGAAMFGLIEVTMIAESIQAHCTVRYGIEYHFNI